MFEVLQYQFMQNALMASVLVSVACGIVGTYVVIKRIVFISGGVAHAAFGGIGLGYWLGINPIVAAIPFSVASAVGIGIISKKIKTGEDTAIGVIWTVGMALGIVFIQLSPGYAPDLFSYLFGSILTVPDIELWLMLLLDVIIVGVSVLFFRGFVALSFDEEFATVVGVPAYLYVVLLCLVGLSVVVLIRVVGVILVIALLSMPAAISRYVTYSIKWLMVISTVVGVLVTVSGLFISYMVDLPSGAIIVLVLGGVMVLSSGLNKYIKE